MQVSTKEKLNTASKIWKLKTYGNIKLLFKINFYFAFIFGISVFFFFFFFFLMHDRTSS